jgi:hypothetical protein
MKDCANIHFGLNKAVDFILHVKNYLSQQPSDIHGYIMGIACLSSFMQVHWTGPPLKIYKNHQFLEEHVSIIMKTRL